MYCKKDNAGCYHGNPYPDSIYKICKQNSITLKRLDYNEPQKGKDQVSEVQFDKSLFKVNGDSIQKIIYYYSFEFTEAGMKVWRYDGIGAGILVPYYIKWSFTSSLMIIKPFKDCLQISSQPSQNKPRASRQLCSLLFARKGDVPKHLNH